ncbi:MAG: glucose 1-dehydrogenase [Desulfobacteraceae bacterium]|jgi:NAD(P)-dependent dehydrogenase (short-subunit alcohol dehydrogenase family)
MDLGLKGKNVIVTGGASNIGRAICLTFGEEGANVAVVDIDEEDGNKVAQMIGERGGKGHCIKADVTKYPEAENAVKAAIDQFGGVDILVNNVGWEDFTPFLEIPVEKYEKYLDLNLRHVLYFTRAVVPHMVEKKHGSIVNISSDAGRLGEFRESIYAAAKGGVISFTKNTAREFGRFQIRANSICPGATLPSEEEIGKKSLFRQEAVLKLFPPEVQEKLAKHGYPLRRLGKGQDLANMVVFIASDRASWITGQTISVSGGYSMF